VRARAVMMPAERRTRLLSRLLLGHLRRYRNRVLEDTATRMLRDQPSGDGTVLLGALNASLRLRQAAAFAFRLEPRRLRTRLVHAMRRHPAENAAVLTLLCPTRQRLVNLRTFVRSVERTAVRPSRVEVLCYVDDDDPALPEYRALFDRSPFHRLGRFELLVGPPVGVPEAWNRLAELADGDLLMMANDDQLYVDHGWDEALDTRVADLVRQHGDDVLCLYFDAGQYPDGGQDFPIVTRTWYETLGYFTPTIFQQWEVEQWIFDIAQRLDRLFAVPGIFVEHRHYQDYKAPFDATYQRHRLTRQKSLGDHALFLRTERQREQEVAKLAAVVAHRSTVDADTLPDQLAAAARRHYRSLIDAYHAAGDRARATACAEFAVHQGVWATAQHRPERFEPGLPVLTAVDPAGFWFTNHLSAGHDRVAAEIRTVLGTWSTGRTDDAELVLFHDSDWTDVASSLPATVAVLSAVSEAFLVSDATITLWRLDGGTRQPASCGHTNTELRVDFAVVAAQGARLRVAGHELSWRSGECVGFDDGLEREAWHDGTDPHVVLTFRVPRPENEKVPACAG
jgi:hypothetical protein